MTAIAAWVREEIGGPKLGDARRDERFLRLVTAVSLNPRGRVSEAIPAGAQRQAAYDFLEHETVSPEAVTRAMSSGAARHCAAFDEVLVALDGSSLSLRDTTGLKGFGTVGTKVGRGVGLKVITGLAMRPDGQPIGILAQEWWARVGKTPKKSTPRPLRERESQHWHNAIAEARAAAVEHARETRLHFIVDREGDASLLMQHLVRERHAFTIRANGTRNVLNTKEKRVNVRAFLKRKAPCVSYQLQLPARAHRAAREATLQVRYASVKLVMRDRHTHKRETMAVTVVWALEEGGGTEALDWMLYTTTPVADAKEALATVQRYTHRWQVEEFHRSWKRGLCEVEETQLRSKAAVIKWATIMSVVAVRAEKLKMAARSTPEAAASDYFSRDELEALVVLKRDEKRKNENVTDEPPTLGLAVRWLADLGGYIGKWNGPPGATIIGRGLNRIEPVAQAIQALRAAGRLR
jgi:hypothetical protein